MLALRNENNEPATVNDIYDAYPRNTKRLYALRFIVDAIEQIAHDTGKDKGEAREWLLGRVQAYAASGLIQERRGTSDWKYIPEPASWFKNGQYMDDDAEWSGTAQTRRKPSEM